MTEASQPVCFFASVASAKTGKPKCSLPAFFLLTPPTIWVSYSKACWEWKVTWRPVMP